MTSGTPDCAECVRLREQAAAALLTGDRSRLSDVRVLQHRHATADHSAQEQQDMSPSAASWDTS